MSLRRRIFALSVGSTAAVAVLFWVPLVVLLNRSAHADVEQRAVTIARGVADYAAAGPGRAELAAYLQRVNGWEDGLPVAVVTSEGDRVGARFGGIGEAVRAPAGGDDHDGDEYAEGREPSGISAPTTVSVDGGCVVVIELTSGRGETRVLVDAPDREARGRVLTGALIAAGVGLVAVLLAGLAAARLSRRLVAGLDREAALADALGAGDLTARVPEDEGPPEVRRVAQALNRLASRIERLLASEREVVADLSHRLRTPLTAVRLDLEALRPAPRVSELERHVDDLERALDVVIRHARRTNEEPVGADPWAIARAAAEFWTPLAEDTGRELSVDVPADAGPSVRTTPTDLRVALDALLENALAHTDDGVPVRVRGRAREEGVVELEIADQGPGVPVTAIERGRSSSGSTGLGLDVARQCAEASGGRLEVGREGPWAAVRLVLGPA